jgi:hypothetical protein
MEGWRKDVPKEGSRKIGSKGIVQQIPDLSVYENLPTLIHTPVGENVDFDSLEVGMSRAVASESE